MPRISIIKILCIHLVAFIWLIPFNPVHSFQIRLAWDQNTESNLAGYKVYYRTFDENYTSYADVGNHSAAEVSHIMPGTEYFFVVTAYDRYGNESGYSNEVNYSLPLDEVDIMPWITMMLLTNGINKPIQIIPIDADSGIPQY
jgi:hypothetical protein